MRVPTSKKFICMVLLPLLAMLTLSSCAPDLTQSTVHSFGETDVLTKDGTMEGTYFMDNGKRFCMEPLIDAIHTAGGGITLGMITGVGNESIGEEISEGAMSLGGMSPQVLLAGLLMYRACELTANLNADEELSLKIYFRFLDAIVKIAPNTGSGAAPIAATMNYPLAKPGAYPTHKKSGSGSSGQGSTGSGSDDFNRKYK